MKENFPETPFRKYTINSDLTIDLNGSIDINNTIIPEYIHFNDCENGYIYIKNSKFSDFSFLPKNIKKLYFTNCDCLTTFEGCPLQKADEIRIIECNNLTSLKGLPEQVTFFTVTNCPNLKDLVGIPQKNVKMIDCSQNTGLTSLKGCPKQMDDDKSTQFIVCGCHSLTNLEGAPQIIKKGTFVCKQNSGIVSMKGAPSTCHSLQIAENNKLESLKGCPKSVSKFSCHDNNKLISLIGLPTTVRGTLEVYGNGGIEQYDTHVFIEAGCTSWRKLVTKKPYNLRDYLWY